MTREEAKRIFLDRGFVEVDGGSIFNGNKWREACRVISEWLEQESCGDAVSRRAVCDTTVCDGISCNECSFNTCEDGQSGCLLKERIEKLPSVTPTRKKGKWEYVGDNCFKCSECGEVYTVDQFNHINNYCDNRFPKGCPNCATEMEGEE